MSDAVTITSRPWANLASYEDAEWHVIYQTLFDGSGDRGPLSNPDEGRFEVTENSPLGMSVLVADGSAIIGGLMCWNTATQTLTVAANGGGATRYDLVFLHWTRANQQVQLRIVDGTGTTCSLAVAPATNAIGTYQTVGPPVTQWAVPLACIAVAPGAVQITNANITDLREFSRFRTDPGDLDDGASIGENASHELYIMAGAVGITEIDAAIAGSALSGGGGSDIDVEVDGASIEIVADQLRITTATAGNGLGGGGAAALLVNVDNSTIEIAADTLRVKAGGLDDSYLPDRIRHVWIPASAMQLESGSAATWGKCAAHPLMAEGWVFPPLTSEYVIAHIETPADFYLSSPSAGYIEFVWTHDCGLVGPYTVYWHFRYISNYACTQLLTGAISQGWAPTTFRVSVTTQDQRLCDQSAQQIVGLSADRFIDLQIGRDGADPTDTYTIGSVVLLGCYFDYTADM